MNHFALTESFLCPGRRSPRGVGVNLSFPVDSSSFHLLAFALLILYLVTFIGFSSNKKVFHLKYTIFGGKKCSFCLDRLSALSDLISIISFHKGVDVGVEHCCNAMMQFYIAKTKLSVA